MLGVPLDKSQAAINKKRHKAVILTIQETAKILELLEHSKELTKYMRLHEKLVLYLRRIENHAEEQS